MEPSNVIQSQLRIDKSGLRKFSLTLTNSQKQFVKLVLNWIKNPQKMLVVVSGGPGTGKSHVVKNTLNFIKTKQLRMSFTKRNAAAIGGQTIYSGLGLPWPVLNRMESMLKWEHRVQSAIDRSRTIMSRFRCNFYPTVILVDEVSLFSGWLMYWVIRFFMDRTESPVLFVCVGDSHQLKPVKSMHNLFSIDTSYFKYELRKIHLSANANFFVPEYEKILNELREFVNTRNLVGMLNFVREHFPVVNVIDDSLLLQANRAMAYTNETVKRYNKFYLDNMVPGIEITIPKDIVLKQDCLVFVTKNDCSQASNGNLLIFQSFNFENNIAICKNPKNQLEVPVKYDKSNKTMPLTLGFATTIHKYESNLIDDEKIVINFDGYKFDLNLVYTALSRVKSMEQIIGIEL